MKTLFSNSLLALVLLFGFTACSSSYYFQVDAISEGPLASGKSFYIVSGNADVKDSDLRFKEAATLVQTALEGKGMRFAKNIQTADLLVELTFGVGEPREVMDVRSYPETQWHPGFTYAIRVPVYDSGGLVIGYDTRVVREPARSYTHWEDRLDSRTVFEKYLEITAFDNRLGAPVEEPTQTWSILVTNSDFSDNIREYLPFMVAAALPYIGEDTGSQISVSLKPDDATAAFIRSPDSVPVSE